MSTTYMEYDPKRGIYVRKDHRDERKPLNCPKGYTVPDETGRVA